MDKNYKIVTANDCHQCVGLVFVMCQCCGWGLVEPGAASWGCGCDTLSFHCTWIASI